MAAPSVLESERHALGCAIELNGEAAELVVTELKPDDFYSEKNRRVFNAIKALFDEGLTVNSVSVSERSLVSLGEVNDYPPATSIANLRTLVADIGRVAGLRSVYYACTSAQANIGKDAKLEEILEGLEKGLYQTDRSGGQDAKEGSEVLKGVIDGFMERYKGGGGPEVSTGLRALDKAIIGLRAGKMVVIAARPSMGKTALADTIRRAVVSQGLGAIQFSLEMDAEEILERELAFQANINLRKVLAAKEVDADELQRVILAGSSGHNFQGRWFIDDRTYSIAGIRRRARILAGRMARQGIKTGVVVLDYIQLAGDNGDGREQSVAAISRGCKLMAKELGCTVLALSQLNRNCEHREDRRPLMSDLRESGSMEQDADVVAFVYREHMYDQSVSPEETEIIIRKQRSGPIGTVQLKYNPKLVTFEDRSEDRSN